MSEAALAVQGLRKEFGPLVACEGLTLDAPGGQILGLVGPDGAGKTTVFRMLCGILQPTAGTARVAGHDVCRDPEAVKRAIGYLPQQFSLHRDLTIDENTRYIADLYQVPRGQWEARRDELLEITYLMPFRHRLAGRLSGGMRQKLALVCSLIHRPQVLFLDEPTTGVDPVSRRDFWKILYDLPRQGVTIVISTPYMDEAVRCNRLVFMFEGRLLAYDTPAALRQQMPGTVLSLRCGALREARVLLQRQPQVQSVEVFGDRLHVVLLPGAEAEHVRTAMHEAGIACEHVVEVEPTLEDAFMALSASETRR
jgi:ABC-2 type transport system ATP-binding protein